MKFIVGLGNPGRKYESTRHNLGMKIIKEFAETNNLKFRKSWRLRSLVSSGNIDNKEVRLACPLTYMNLSGNAVARLMKLSNVDLSELLVVCDDINLELGKVRIRASGSDGGHNGLKSIADNLRTDNFARLRIGVGGPHLNEDLTDFVLSEFTGKEEEKLVHAIDMAKDCLYVWLRDGIQAAMSKFN